MFDMSPISISTQSHFSYISTCTAVDDISQLIFVISFIVLFTLVFTLISEGVTNTFSLGAPLKKPEEVNQRLSDWPICFNLVCSWRFGLNNPKLFESYWEIIHLVCTSFDILRSNYLQEVIDVVWTCRISYVFSRSENNWIIFIQIDGLEVEAYFNGPVRSPDLTVLDFYLGKTKRYSF